MTNCQTCQRDLVAGESCRRLACLWHDIAAAALDRPPETVTLYATVDEFLAAVNGEVPA